MHAYLGICFAQMSFNRFCHPLMYFVRPEFTWTLVFFLGYYYTSLAINKIILLKWVRYILFYAKCYNDLCSSAVKVKVRSCLSSRTSSFRDYSIKKRNQNIASYNFMKHEHQSTFSEQS